MRMRKKQWALPYLEAHEQLCYPNGEQYYGKWNELFNKEVLHLEIGAGKGGYIQQMSKLYPEIGWIAIEKDTSCAAVLAKKLIEEDSCDNIRLIYNDATDVLKWFKKKEIDVIHLNFSDPWPKNGYRKRRLTHASFLNQYKEILKDEGKLILKTDNQGLFEFSVMEFTNNGWKIDDIWVDFRRESHSEDAITEYEQKFMDLGQPIYRAIFSIRK